MGDDRGGGGGRRRAFAARDSAIDGAGQRDGFFDDLGGGEAAVSSERLPSAVGRSVGGAGEV
jgi:hypothetical protein